MPDLDQLEIVSTVLHYIETEKDAGSPKLLLTDQEIDLDVDLTRYFRSKVVDRLEQKGLEVVVDGDKPQVVPTSLQGVLVDPSQLVEQSKVIAQHLFETQTKVNSSGLLAVISCKLVANSADTVALVKLERQRGVSFAIDEKSGSVDLELLRNLTLTDKTKVYKTALFSSENGALGGLVADDQRTTAKGSPVAGFFLGDFLGCRPKEPASILTYKFVRAASQAISDLPASAETKGRYQVGLLSVIQDNSIDIRPKSFAVKYLDAPHRADFLKAVQSAGIEPTKSFTKDASRVSVKQFQVSFDSGMVLIGPPQAWEENVSMPDDPSSTNPVQLKDTVTNVLTAR